MIREFFYIKGMLGQLDDPKSNADWLNFRCINGCWDGRIKKDGSVIRINRTGGESMVTLLWSGDDMPTKGSYNEVISHIEESLEVRKYKVGNATTHAKQACCYMIDAKDQVPFVIVSGHKDMEYEGKLVRGRVYKFTSDILMFKDSSGVWFKSNVQRRNTEVIRKNLYRCIKISYDTGTTASPVVTETPRAESPKKETTMQNLHQTKDGKFGVILTTNQDGKAVFQEAGTETVTAVDPAELTKVVPYTVKCDNGHHYEAVRGSVKVGDVLVVKGFNTFTTVTALNTEQFGCSTLSGQILKTKSVG